MHALSIIGKGFFCMAGSTYSSYANISCLFYFDGKNSLKKIQWLSLHCAHFQVNIKNDCTNHNHSTVL